ncbi:caspase-8-like [Amphibalanus amphitrite]|uniref:caspase-8-like n=1 Tax=Amphibalanus amphitrite TaxID=1232801 RepID=UPI001C902D26|nr:caspase-8-like [Amphibalanus amphitrite]
MTSSSLGVEDVFRFADVTSEEGGWLVVNTLTLDPDSPSDVSADAVSYPSAIDSNYERYLTEDDLQDIEGDLYPEEVVRMLFLAVDDTPALVLQKCVVKMTHSQRSQSQTKSVDSFFDWARAVSDSKHSWKALFLESLAVIGRHDILVDLGCDDAEIRRLEKPVHLSSLKVSLNQVCCSLKQGETAALISYVSKQHLQNRPPTQFPEGVIIKQLLELNILQWMQEGIMDLMNLTVLVEALEHIGRPDLKNVLMGRPVSQGSSYTSHVSGPPSGGHTKVVSLPSLAGVPTPHVYPNDRGICVIFNLEQFRCVQNPSCVLQTLPNHGLRLGSSLDAGNLSRLFGKFSCRTKVFTNMKGHEIQTCLKNLANAKDLAHFDFVVVCFLSHGGTSDGRQFIYSSDCQLMFIDDLISPFEGDSCQSLRGKMKMVISQSCQGEGQLTHLQADGPPVSPTPSSSARTATAQSDFLFCQATTPGFKAYRDPRRGSFYIMRLCEVLESRGHLEEVSLCIKDVHKLLIEQPILLGEERVPCAIQPQMIDRTQGRFRFKRAGDVQPQSV